VGSFAPVAGWGGGTLVVDGSIAGVGRLDGPVTLTVRSGHLSDASGQPGAQLLELLTVHGDDGTSVAELGIGTNEAAILTGNILEDEKILGTAHLAFGASAAIGGTVQVPVHLDCVVLEPTVEIDGEPLVRDGELLV
jgi:leucyl aminopeptidase (aminopeptidase T)